MEDDRLKEIRLEEERQEENRREELRPEEVRAEETRPARRHPAEGRLMELSQAPEGEELTLRLRKDKIKNAIILFLTVLLVLTFFSNTWMNRTLPEVATAYVQRGSISPKIRGTGTVEADNPYQVMVKQSRKVSNVLVRPGDVVEQGTPLLELEDMESEELLTAEKELAAAEKSLADTKAAYETSMFGGNVGDQVITQVRRGGTESWDSFQAILRSSTERYEAAEVALREATAAVEELTAKRDVELKQLDDQIAQYGYEQAALQQKVSNGDADDDDKRRVNELTRNVSQVTTYKSQVSNSYEIRLTEAGARKAQAQREYDVAKKERDELLTSIGTQIGLETSRGSVAAAEAEVERVKAQVEKLRADAEGTTVDAPVAGTITTVGYVAGETTKADTPAAVIQVAGRDMVVSFSVTNAQARKVHVGDAAEPQNAWYYTDFSASLRAIKNDPSDPAGKKLLEFTVASPEVQAGQSVSLQIGQVAQNYDLTVPNSAVREDNNGKFVLVVRQKPSPLGNRYIADRVEVEVKESDDNQTGITAALSGYEYVITTSSEPVRPGQYVRLADSTAG